MAQRPSSPPHHDDDNDDDDHDVRLSRSSTGDRASDRRQQHPQWTPDQHLVVVLVPWIEDYGVCTLLTGRRRPTISVPHIGHITQLPDRWGRTIVSDGRHSVVAQLQLSGTSSWSMSSSLPNSKQKMNDDDDSGQQHQQQPPPRLDHDISMMIRPGLYRLIDYEMVLTASNDNDDHQDYDYDADETMGVPPAREPQVSIHLVVSSLHPADEDDDDDDHRHQTSSIINKGAGGGATGAAVPQPLTHAVALRRILQLPRGDLRSCGNNGKLLDHVVVAAAAAQEQHPQQQYDIVPLGRVSEAWRNENVLDAILRQRQPPPAPVADRMPPLAWQEPMNSKNNNKNDDQNHRHNNVSLDTDNNDDDWIMKDPIAIDHAEEEQEEQEPNMGIDAMLVMEEEEEEEAEFVHEPPGIILRKTTTSTMNDDDDDDDDDATWSDATPMICNNSNKRRIGSVSGGGGGTGCTPGRVSPPPRVAHHAGEVIRAWMNDGAAEQVVVEVFGSSSSKSQSSGQKSLPLEQRQYAGDGIRAWLLSDLLEHNSFG
jgi:hypothetical protein